MKKHTALVASFAIASIASAGAFTLDAISYEGTTLDSTPVSVVIPGYGSLVFEALEGSIMPVDRQFENETGSGAPSMSFDSGEVVKITFVGPEPLNVDFEFAGVGIGEYFTVDADLVTPQAFIVRLNGSPNAEAGITSMSWNAVPEPSSALLGLIGTSMLVLRRRR